MDTVFLRGLSVAGRHGVFERERKVEQEFLLDIEATFDTRIAAESDRLEDTLDYVRFRDIAVETIRGASHFLIEKLAGDIAGRILEGTRIASVSVTIRKPAVLESGVPGITITRSRT